jgi:polar amino acid transport system substrate-binding protein
MDVRSDLAPTGTLRASINLGNPVLAQGTPAAPSGVTVDIARELAARLGVPAELVCFGAARDSLEAMKAGRADICFLAIDPARAETVAFTPPYAVIEGVFAVPPDSPFTSSADVDRPGVRVAVNQGSAYDLFLSRTLAHAEVVRGDEGTKVFTERHLEAVAGIRQPLEVFAAAHPGVRLLEPRFMEIQQAVGTTRTRSDDTLGFLRSFVEELKADGFVAEALRRAGRRDATVAPPDATVAPPAP